MTEMTGKEIIKALECCCTLNGVGCQNCPQYDIHSAMCVKNLIRNALDLINSKQAEIERLKEENTILSQNADTAFQDGLNEAQDLYALQIKNDIKSRAIKDFANKLKNEIIDDTAYAEDCTQHTGYYDYTIKIGDIPEYIDNLVKEMVGDE